MKGSETPHSPTLDEGWMQDTLGAAACQDRIYDESIIRNEVDKIQVFDAYIQIFHTDGSHHRIKGYSRMAEPMV